VCTGVPPLGNCRPLHDPRTSIASRFGKVHDDAETTVWVGARGCSPVLALVVLTRGFDLLLTSARFGVAVPQVWRERSSSFLGGFIRACAAHLEGRDEAGKVRDRHRQRFGPTGSTLTGYSPLAVVAGGDVTSWVWPRRDSQGWGQ